MRGVLARPDAPGPAEVYYMYRDVGYPGDRRLLRSAGLRYDLTVLVPGAVGGEYVKTHGHYHPHAAGQDVSYPEVYEVVDGIAHFLLQRPGSGQVVEDVVVVEARPGDKVLIPPGYGHLTINPGPDFLVVANLTADGFCSLYAPFALRRGGAYYEMAAEGGGRFIPNPAYGPVPPLRRAAPVARPDLGLQPGIPLYRSAVSDPARFRFLVEPRGYLDAMVL